MTFFQSMEHEPFPRDLELLPIKDLIYSRNWEAITGESPADSIFTVIIPAHNEEKSIRKVIYNLQTQQIPRESQLRINVISNGSTDDTCNEVLKCIRDVEAYSNISINLLDTPEAGKTKALNVGRAVIRSDILIHVDADTYPTSTSLSRLYVLMRAHSGCMVASVLPRRIKGENEGVLQHMQDYYDATTRTNGAIIGKCLAYRPNAFPDFPEDTGSDDTWLEYMSISKYGPNSVMFLGQTNSSDALAEYKAPTSMGEYFAQLVRWESQFRNLLTTYPELRPACRMANRVKEPKDLLGIIQYLHNNYPEIPLKDKVLMYSLLRGVRKFAKSNIAMNLFKDGSSWISPKSDRI